MLLILPQNICPTTYDQFGNITNYQGMTINYATNASGAPATNRISTAVVGGTTYTHTYDNAGNLTNDGSQSYVYDGANRLKQAGSSGQSTYGYDGDGARVRKMESGAALFYVRSSVLGAVAMEVNSSSVVRAYVYSNGKLVAELSSDNNFYWIHKDHLGSGRKLTDSTGALQFRSEYSAYGQLLLNWSAFGATNPSTRKFTGYERDAATGLDYASARMYGSNYGRFTSPDPAGQKATDSKRPQSLNRYSYVENDPVNFRDPSGKLLAPAGGGDGCITYYLDGIFWFNTCGQVTLGENWGGYSGGGGSGGSSGTLRPPVLKLTVSAAPKATTKCGEAYGQYEFSIENKAPGVDGWVIQHVIRSVEVVDKDGNRLAPINGARSVEYWEAWTVKDGYVYSPVYGPIGIDRWQMADQGSGTAGTWDMVGFAKFIPVGSGINPNAWSNNVPEAGGLRSTATRPAGWTDVGAVHNSMEVIWDCTTSPPANPVVR